MSEHITLKCDDDLDVSFTGEELASVSSWKEGSQRWTELDLYRTAGGTLICHEIGASKVEGERTRFAVHTADSEPDLIEQVGTGWLAKELYRAAGIKAVNTIN